MIVMTINIINDNDPQELIAAGYNVEPSYKPYISSEELHDTVQETCGQFFIRNFFITQCALQATEEAGGNVLLVGHAATLDTCSRQLVGGEPRQVNELMSIVRKVSSQVMLLEVLPIFNIDVLCRCRTAVWPCSRRWLRRMSCSVAGAPPPRAPGCAGRVAPPPVACPRCP